MITHSPLIYAALSGVLCLGSVSVPLSAMATEITGSDGVVFADGLPQEAIFWTISGPDGVQSSGSDTIIAAGLSDGTYTYEITGYLQNPDIPVPTAAENESNGRHADVRPADYAVGVINSGAFTIKDGVVVSAETDELEPTSRTVRSSNQ